MKTLQSLTGREVTLYDDSVHLFPQFAKSGMIPRKHHPLYAAYGSALPKMEDAGIALVPRSEWPDRMAEMDAKKMWPADWITWPAKNQQTTNFCWANGPCGAAELIRVMQGLPYVELSAASVTCMVNGYVNRGGYGLDAVTYMAETGACPVELWPNCTIDRRLDTVASQAMRKRFRTYEFVDLPTTFDAVVSALLNGFPVAVGYDWWGHEVFAVAADALSRTEFTLMIRNSWGDWGSKYAGQSGFASLTETKGTPDDAQAIRAVSPAV